MVNKQRLIGVFRNHPYLQLVFFVRARETVKNKKLIGQGKLIKLQAGKQDVNEVETDQECGIEYQGKPLIQEGDLLQFYKEEKITKKI